MLFLGLYAAYLLNREKLDVAVLEARDRVGGRTWTLRGVWNIHLLFVKLDGCLIDK